MIKLSDEQIVARDAIINCKDKEMVAIPSTAGSGKSTLLVETNKLIPGRKLYITFSKALVTEAEQFFTKDTEVKTFHAFCYNVVIYQGLGGDTPGPRTIGSFTFRNVNKKLDDDTRRLIVQHMEKFFASEYVSIKQYLKDYEVDDLVGRNVIGYTKQMVNKQRPVTFSFLAKWYHILLYRKQFTPPMYDVLMADECIAEDTYVNTSEGFKTIKALFYMKNGGSQYYKKRELPLVKSFNHTIEEFEYKKVLNAVYKGERQVYKVKTEGLSSFECTDNHKILTQRGYVETKDIIIGQDYVLQDGVTNQKTKYLPNKDMEQLILGSYAGDGCLQQVEGKKVHSYSLSFTQGIKQLEYMKWKVKLLGFNNKIKSVKSGYTQREDIYQSNRSKMFLLDGDPFELLLTRLSNFGLAIWIMDDASISNNSIVLHSNNFSKEQNLQLIEMFKSRFNCVDPKLQKIRKYYEIKFNVKDTRIILDHIKSYIHPVFKNKFDGDFIPNKVRCNWKSYGGNYIASITPTSVKKVYDIEVKDNHNFLVSKSRNSTCTIVHNCQDFSRCGLEIIKLLPAKRKAIVGDSCFPGRTKIRTTTGWRTLSSILRSLSKKEAVYVTSFNEDKQVFEDKQVVNHFKKGTKTTAKLILDGNSVRATLDHKFFTTRGWIKMSELTAQDTVITYLPNNEQHGSKFIPNNEQMQLIYGSFLGDGHLDYQPLSKKERTSNLAVRPTVRLSLAHSEKQKEYLKYKASFFTNDFTQILSYAAVSDYGSNTVYKYSTTLFYLPNKLTLEEVVCNMNAFALAIWFMDDGSVTNYDYKTKTIPIGTRLHCNSFSKDETLQLIEMLNTRFEIKCKLRVTHDGYNEIAIGKVGTTKLLELVRPYVTKDLMYKVHKGKDSIIPSKSNYTTKPYSVMKVVDIRDYKTENVFDIEVKDNHNFVVSSNSQKMSSASGIVAHNCQMIFASFTHATNGFNYLKDQITKTHYLTKSFRVNVKDATYVQAFMRHTVDEDYVFTGHDHHNTTIRTTGYITRNNSSLIAKMLELEEEGVEYRLARKVGNLFALVITLSSLKKGNEIYGDYSFLNYDVEQYYKDKTVNRKTTSLFKYVMNKHRSDVAIKSACAIVAKYGKKAMFDLYYKAKATEKSKKQVGLICGTCHTFKGLTVDRAILDPSLNIDYLKDDKLSEVDKFNETLLRFVAISRHKHRLDGASWLYSL